MDTTPLFVDMGVCPRLAQVARLFGPTGDSEQRLMTGRYRTALVLEDKQECDSRETGSALLVVLCEF